MKERGFIGRIDRKTIPTSRENEGRVSNQRDRPCCLREDLEQLSIAVVGASNTCLSVGSSFKAEKIVIASGYDRQDTVVRLTPDTRVPLTAVFYVPHGGGRVYGGGTSKKALQTAKQKA